MGAQILKNPDDRQIRRVGEALRNGRLVAIPTETVYGLGANGLDAAAMDKIYAAKGRPSDNPLILHVPSADSIRPLVKEITPTARALTEAFWPGPLTVILPKSDLVPDRATGGLPGVALRCPDHELCRRILSAAGVPVAAPSANRSGRPSPTTADDVYRDLGDRIDYIIDAGPCEIGVESTVVEVRDDAAVILRPGGITGDMLRRVVSSVTYDAALSDASAAPKAPGMKYKHYAPEAPMYGFVGEPEAVARAMTETIGTADGSVGLLISHETFAALPDDDRFITRIFGHHGDAAALAHDFYKSLLQFNEHHVTLILAEGVRPDGMGVAVMNRMMKASAGHIRHV